MKTELCHNVLVRYVAGKFDIIVNLYFHSQIRVDEKGSEAAAATSFISARVYIESFVANQPFIYTIYDKSANVPLFFGVYNHPEPQAT